MNFDAENFIPPFKNNICNLLGDLQHYMINLLFFIRLEKSKQIPNVVWFGRSLHAIKNVLLNCKIVAKRI